MNNIENTNTALQPVQTQNPSVPADIQQGSLAATENYSMVNSAFVKGLVAAILSSLPIGSIVAIFLGSASTKLVAKLRDHAAANGIKPSGKNIAAKILGLVGKIEGIVMTVYWAIFFVIYVIWLIVVFTAINDPEKLESLYEFFMNL